MESLSDWKLLVRTKQGSEAACTEIMRRYERLLYFLPRQYGMRSEDCDDMVQQTFVAMIERIDTFHEESNLKGWLTTVCKRNCWAKLRRGDREEVHHEPLTESTLMMGLTTTDGDRAATAEWLLDGLREIDARCRELLLALYFAEDEPSYEDVAAQFGMKLGSVGPTRGRCLKKLKAVLTDEG